MGPAAGPDEEGTEGSKAEARSGTPTAGAVLEAMNSPHRKPLQPVPHYPTRQGLTRPRLTRPHPARPGPFQPREARRLAAFGRADGRSASTMGAGPGLRARPRGSHSAGRTCAQGCWAGRTGRKICPLALPGGAGAVAAAWAGRSGQPVFRNPGLSSQQGAEGGQRQPSRLPAASKPAAGPGRRLLRPACCPTLESFHNPRRSFRPRRHEPRTCCR